MRDSTRPSTRGLTDWLSTRWRQSTKDEHCSALKLQRKYPRDCARRGKCYSSYSKYCLLLHLSQVVAAAGSASQDDPVRDCAVLPQHVPKAVGISRPPQLLARPEQKCENLPAFYTFRKTLLLSRESLRTCATATSIYCLEATLTIKVGRLHQLALRVYFGGRSGWLLTLDQQATTSHQQVMSKPH